MATDKSPLPTSVPAKRIVCPTSPRTASGGSTTATKPDSFLVVPWREAPLRREELGGAPLRREEPSLAAGGASFRRDEQGIGALHPQEQAARIVYRLQLKEIVFLVFFQFFLPKLHEFV